eukprot:848782-Rhodomonas_salina.2
MAHTARSSAPSAKPRDFRAVRALAKKETTCAARNQMQATAVPVQTVRATQFFSFDFATCGMWKMARSNACWVCVPKRTVAQYRTSRRKRVGSYYHVLCRTRA